VSPEIIVSGLTGSDERRMKGTQTAEKRDDAELSRCWSCAEERFVEIPVLEGWTIATRPMTENNEM